MQVVYLGRDCGAVEAASSLLGFLVRGLRMRQVTLRMGSELDADRDREESRKRREKQKWPNRI